MKRLFLTILLLCGSALATTRYVAQSAGTFSGGTACNGQTAITPATWNSTSESAGDVTYVCGALTSSTQGGTGFTFSWSGSSGNPISLIFDTGASMVSTGWWGNYTPNTSCPTCTGAITINGFQWIVIDGGTNGLIENSLSGCVTGSVCNNGSGGAGTGHPATCPAGSCTQSPGSSGTVGIHLGTNGGTQSDNIIIRNLEIGPLYVGTGSNSSVTDTGGLAAVSIRVDSDLTTAQIYNNNLHGAQTQIYGGFDGSLGPNSCPNPPSFTFGTLTSGAVCIAFNNLYDGNWHFQPSDGGANNVVNFFGNNLGDVTGAEAGWGNWQYPTGTYHQNGVFCWGAVAKIVNAYVYDNYLHGDLGAGSPSAILYIANGGGTLPGCAMTAFNNIIAMTGTNVNNDQATAVKLDATSGVMGPIIYENNTIIGSAYQLEFYNNNTGPQDFAFTNYNNIWSPGSSGNTAWFFHQEDASNPFISYAGDYNDFYNGNNNPWAYNGTNYGPAISNWTTGCTGAGNSICDQHSVSGAPNLTSSYIPNSGSPVIGAGKNLYGTYTALNYSAPANFGPGGSCGTGCVSRPSTGAWDEGAMSISSGGPPLPPTGLTATVSP